MHMRYREMDVRGIVIEGRSFVYAKQCQNARETKSFDLYKSKYKLLCSLLEYYLMELKPVLIFVIPL